MVKPERSVDPRAVGSEPLVGFLSVVDHPENGLLGGFLVLNARGRPIEFHCTTPCKPNRAQAILYGATLKPFLYGEQIGLTLLTKCQSQIAFVCTDVEPALAVRDWVHLPVAWVVSDTAAPSASETDERNVAATTSDTPHAAQDNAPARSWRLDSPESNIRGMASVKHRGLELILRPGYGDDSAAISQQLASLAGEFDLSEPFVRIRAALDETQRPL